jgi:WS/DGAT/MGAT family acyltransferase
LNAFDASFLYLERLAQPLHVASVLTFEGALDFGRLLTLLRTRVPLLPHYTDRMMPAPLGLAHPSWEPDPEFDLSAHVHHHILRPSGGDKELADLCAALYAQPLDRAKPLWEVHLIDDCGGSAWRAPHPASTKAGGPGRHDARRGSPRSALFVKAHHCLIDGISGVQVLGVLLDTSIEARPVVSPGARRHPELPGVVRRLVGALSDRAAAGIARGVAMATFVGRPRSAVAKLRETGHAMAHVARTFLAEAPRTPFNGRTGRDRRLAWVSLSLAETKAIKNQFGGSLNDVVLAVTSGALRRLLLERGADPGRLELRALVPVTVRSPQEHLTLGNRISMMVVPLPVGIHDPVERLRQVHMATAHLKADGAAAKVARILQLVELLLPQLTRLAGWVQRPGASVNTICTNVPGPTVSLYQQGVRLDRLIPFAPIVDGIGVAFAVLSYEDTLTLGITADPGLVPDVQAVVTALRTSFQELSAATGVAAMTPRRSELPGLEHHWRLEGAAGSL